jgi:hypothetical protein
LLAERPRSGAQLSQTSPTTQAQTPEPSPAIPFLGEGVPTRAKD